MPKKIEMTRAHVSEWLSYAPETGVFTWLKSPARSIRAGSEAGSRKSVHTTVGQRFYRYIVFQGVDTPASRVAWLLHYGEWPTVPVLFDDGDSQNLRIANLKLARFPTDKSMVAGRRVYKMSKDAMRSYGLKRYYGLTAEQFGAMMAAQHGVCAICSKPETTVVGAGVKPLSVDHCHMTNAIRGLLCHHCNHGLGHFMDDPAALRAAADYIEKHAKATANVVALKPPTDGG